MGFIVAIVSDMHVNSTVGLSVPTLELDDGGDYRASPTQRNLWTCWNVFWDEVERLKTETGYGLLVVFNGDVGELDVKSRTHQLVSRNKSTALRHARTVIERPVGLADWSLFIRGTASHVGKSSWFEEELAADTTNAVRNGESASWYAWRGHIGGVLMDFKHFVRLGAKPWTRTNPLGELSNNLEMDAYRKRQPVPTLAIRSHRHFYADTANNHPVRVIVTPCWQAIPEYISAVDGIEPPDIGGLVVTIDEGRWTAIPRRFPMKPPKIQTLPDLMKPTG